MHNIIETSRSDFDKALEHLKTELQSIRGNRAHPSLVEDVKVEVYGSEMRLQEVATITVPESRTIQVQPWDKSVIKDIERSLNSAQLNIAIANDGDILRLAFPPLTSESRAELLKVLGQKLEQSRVQVRQIREKIREKIIKAERDKELTEDERYTAQKDLDEVVKEYTQKIKELGERKEIEINTV